MRRNRRGISLIESMIATMVLGLTVATLAALFPAGVQLREKSGNVSRASAFLSRKLEQVRQYTYEQLTYATLFNARVIDEQPDGAVSTTFAFTQVDDLAGQLATPAGRLIITHLEDDLARVDIEITWGGIVMLGNRVQATTYVTNKNYMLEPT